MRHDHHSSRSGGSCPTRRSDVLLLQQRLSRALQGKSSTSFSKPRQRIARNPVPAWRPSTPARCIRRSGRKVQGSCPICGMALEPVTVSLEDQPNEELEDMTRRFRFVARADASDSRVHGVGVPTWPAAAAVCPASRTRWQLDGARAGHAGRAVGRMAVLRARVGVDRQPPSQHVHADRARRWRGLRLQRR